MFIRNPQIKNGVLYARNTFYSLSPDIDVRADPIFRTPGLVSAGFAALFGFGFRDLLYPHELLAIVAFAVVSIVLGFSFARLVIIKPSLRGSELSVAGYDTYPRIRRIAAEIAEAAQSQKEYRS